ncbi:hypothetical protein K0U00_10090, partial [Paenibacillus sepulcri]|nr:hypothetical protein [Paenibacillus sepulcri]
MLHPFMGIKDYGKVGMSVAESSHKLHRIGYVDRRLMKLEAGHMVARPEYEVKGALSRLMWQDASHCDQLRSRCKQLRMSSSAFDKSPDPNLELLMDEVLKSADTLQLMRALFEVVKPDQIRSARAYMASAQPIVDEPTIHLLKHQLMDREEQLEWGNEAVRHFTADATEKMVADADRWVEYLRNLLAAAGGIDGDLAKEEPDPELAVA